MNLFSVMINLTTNVIGDLLFVYPTKDSSYREFFSVPAFEEFIWWKSSHKSLTSDNTSLQGILGLSHWSYSTYGAPVFYSYCYIIYRCRKSAVINQHFVCVCQSLSPKELWHIVHQCYGTELGLTSEDDDYVSPTAEHMNGLLWVFVCNSMHVWESDGIGVGYLILSISFQWGNFCPHWLKFGGIKWNTNIAI